MDGSTYDHVILEVNVLVLHAKYDERLRMDLTIEDAGRLRGHVIRTLVDNLSRSMLWEAEHTRHIQIHLGKTLALLHLLWTTDEQILKLTLIL